VKRLRGHPIAQLILLGAGSQVIYLTMVLLYPLTVHGQADRPYDLEKLSRGRPSSAFIYVIGLIALFVAFWAALRIARRNRVPVKLIVAFGLIFGFTLTWLYPITADDLFRYVLRARLRVVYGENPFLVPVSGVPGDPMHLFAGQWGDHLSPYGPIWELIAEGVVWMGLREPVSGALAYKVVVWLAYLACTGLLAWGTRGDSRALLIFAWNPLVLIQGPGNGHNDLVMMALMVLGLVLWERKRSWALAVAAMSLAVLTKLSAALMAPLLMVAILRSQPTWWRRVAILIGAAAIAAGLIVLAYLPFPPLEETLGGILEEMSRSYTYTIAAFARMVLREFIPNDLAMSIPRVIGRVTMLLIYGWALVRVALGRTRLAEAGFLVYFCFLLTNTGYRIWYPLWLVPLAVLHCTPRTRLRTVLISLTSELSILMFYLLWRWVLNGETLPNGLVLPDASWLAMHAITVPWQYGLPLFLPLRLPKRWRD